MKSIIRFVPIILLALALTACSSAKTINQDMNGSTINIGIGETLKVKLEGNPTTGYEWQLASVEESILNWDGVPQYKSDSKLVGAGGEYTFVFEGKSPGTTHLEFSYLRPWEEGIDPIETFTLTVVVE